MKTVIASWIFNPALAGIFGNNFGNKTVALLQSLEITIDLAEEVAGNCLFTDRPFAQESIVPESV